MSNLFNITKLIVFQLDPIEATGLAQIFVPFPVKEILVRQIVYQDDQTYTGLNTNASLHSDLVQNQCLGIVNIANTAYQSHASGVGGVRFTYANPVSVSGQYNFQLRSLNSNPFDLTDLGTHQMGLLIEFIGINGVITNVSI
jgi:hypothetical protein